MQEEIVIITGWSCELCGYHQDVYSEENHALIFPETPSGCCPNCFALGTTSALTKMESNPQTSIVVASDETLGLAKVNDLANDGQPIMIQTGERYELRVNQQTGAVYSELVPIFEQKMRELTTQELADLKEQRDRSLDELEKVAV